MSNIKRKIGAGTIAVIIWLAINAVFMALEVTIFKDAADPNNWIILVLSTASIVGLVFAGKYGVALATFAATYAFSFNAFNLLYYFGFNLLNVISALLNMVTIIFLFITLLKRD